MGARWERREWNVAQEHAATAVVDAALALLALEGEVEPSAGRAVVACVEGEWHSLPARMAAELLRLQGWDVTFLGPSVPADDLGAHVRALAPEVVGLSCSVPLFLKGAERSIEACRAAGVPAVAGGAGFGAGGRWATRLGARGWAPDARSAGPLLADAAPAPPPAGPAADDVDHLLLESERTTLVARTVDALLAVGGAPADGPAVAQLREALDALLTSIESACLVGDSDVVAACVPVVERLLPGRRAGGISLADVVPPLLADVGQRSVRAAALAERGLRAVRGGALGA